MKSLDDARVWPAHLRSRLQQLTAVLSGVVEPAETARLTVEHGMGALAADAGVVFLMAPDGAFLRVAHACGYPQEAVGPWVRFPLSSAVPATDAFRTREP